MRISDWSSDVCSSDLTRCLPRQVYAGSSTSRTKPTADGKDEVVTNLRHPFYCTNPTVLQMSIAPKGWHPDDRDDRRVRELAQKFFRPRRRRILTQSWL